MPDLWSDQRSQDHKNFVYSCPEGCSYSAGEAFLWCVNKRTLVAGVHLLGLKVVGKKCHLELKFLSVEARPILAHRLGI